MKKRRFHTQRHFALAIAAISSLPSMAQKVSNATFLKTNEQRSDVVVPFRYDGTGAKTPIEWGLDLAWLSEDNMRIGTQYAGKEIIDIVRLSFQPTANVENGFSSAQKRDLDKRYNIVKKWCKSDVTYNINCDHPSLDDWYNDAVSSTERAQNWAKLIDMTADYYKQKGLKNLVSISPFNEPDYEYHHLPTFSHRMADFKNICKVLKEDEKYKDKYEGVRLCGGNTLNDDEAYKWWNYLKDYLDEGNTHQLAGNFDNYAKFFETLRSKGYHATNDELHNVMEGIVGAEYGMQTAIWWGTCEHTRSDFMKATYQGNTGERLGYGEHRPNWTAAAVYRHANGRVQAFGGTSERQAATTVYRFVSTDQPVWYDGVRSRDYVMDVVGGTGYQKGQTDFEMAVDVQAGEDIMPHIDGVYKIVNVNSGMVLTAASNNPTGWQAIKQNRNKTANPASQQWSVKPYTAENIAPYDLRGDRSYHIIQLNNGKKGTFIDIKDWNNNDGAEVGTYPGGFGSIEQWYLEYAGDNSFYIRSRFNAKCIEVKNSSKSDGTAVQMAEVANKANQKWRFVAIETVPDTSAPSAPTNLQAKANNASVDLTWDAVGNEDLKSYTILRSTDGEKYYTLCNDLTATSFTDNETREGQHYYYKVMAEDASLNRSIATEAVECEPNAENGQVVNLPLTADTYDHSNNANHAAMGGAPVLTNYKQADCLSMNGTTDYLQLPYTVASHKSMTISAWIYYRGGDKGQRIFDFGNGSEQCMYLSPNTSSQLRFVIKDGSKEVALGTTALATTRWNHVAVTLSDQGIALYVNGVKKAENSETDLRPDALSPTLNYVGRGQSKSDPMLKGYLHSFQILNYALSPDEIEQLATDIDDITSENISKQANTRYDLNGRRATQNHKGIIVEKGKKISL